MPTYGDLAPKLLGKLLERGELWQFLGLFVEEDTTMESKHQPLRPCGCDCATPCPNGKTGSERSCMIPAVDVSLAQPDNPARAPTHRCKICGAMWVNYSASYDAGGTVVPGGWSLASKECGQCCDNVAMGAQIEALPRKWRVCARCSLLHMEVGVVCATCECALTTGEKVISKVFVTKEALDGLGDKARMALGLPTAVDKALDALSLEQRVELLEGKCAYQSDDCFCGSLHRGHFAQLGLLSPNLRVISALGEQVRARLRDSIKLIAEDGSMTTQQRLAWAMESHPDRRTPEFMDAFAEAAAQADARAKQPKRDTRSLGTRLVGYRTDDTPDLTYVRDAFRIIIDKLDAAREGYARDGANDQRGRLASIAITEAEGACLWAVKALTS